MCKRDEQLHVSIVVSIPACHAGDRGSIPRRGVLFLKIIIETHCISGSAFDCVWQVLKFHIENLWFTLQLANEFITNSILFNWFNSSSRDIY